MTKPSVYTAWCFDALAIDPNRPEKGVQVQMSNGDSCSGASRAALLMFYCDPVCACTVPLCAPVFIHDWTAYAGLFGLLGMIWLGIIRLLRACAATSPPPGPGVHTPSISPPSTGVPPIHCLLNPGVAARQEVLARLPMTCPVSSYLPACRTCQHCFSSFDVRNCIQKCGDVWCDLTGHTKCNTVQRMSTSTCVELLLPVNRRAAFARSVCVPRKRPLHSI